MSLAAEKPVVPSRRRFTRLMGGALLGAAGALALQGTMAHLMRIGVDPDETRCLPWRTYVMLEGRPDPVRVGTLVRFNPGRLMDVPGKGPANKGREVIKLVVAVGGDRVEIRADQTMVNGTPLTRLVQQAIEVELEESGLCQEVVDNLGQSIETFERSFLVPSNAVFVVGTARRSFDSRYWGPLPVSAITARAWPMI